MPADSELESLRYHLALTQNEVADLRQSVEGLRRMLDLLVTVLVARGDLGEGHPRLLEKVRSRPNPNRPLHLGLYPDKYAVPSSGIDCPSLIHLCKARCCGFEVFLTRQDVEERKLAFVVEEPYVLKRGTDGYCVYLERTTGGCTTYECRPGTCRAYDCREDKRVWLDFDAKIPAPLPPNILKAIETP